MDFESATEIAQRLEQLNPKLLIAGFRRTSNDRLASWAIDVVNLDTGMMITFDEKDDIGKQLTEIFSDFKLP
ncbi:MAG TPA: hypothetical protein VJB57_11295 [Dehalococcoidia bacterium]|nr:hypothetical protein [Dehalococcoidia bacterium]